MDSRRRPRRGRRNPRRATSATRSCSRRPTRSRPRPRRSSFRWPSGSARTSSTSSTCRKGFGDNLLIDDLTFKLPPGGIVGVIGPNGAGKTTLFRMITGQEKPDAGTIKVGESVQLGYVDQSRDALDGKKNVWEEISNGQDIILLGKKEVNCARLCLGVQLQGRRPAEEGRLAVGRRAQPRASRQDAEVRRQPAAARRADQRSRRRYAARAGRGAGGFRRLRRHHQPRPLVPRPHRHPHPGVRGRQPRRMVRGQLPGLREGQDAPARHGFDHPAPDQDDSVIPHRIKYKKFSR